VTPKRAGCCYPIVAAVEFAETHLNSKYLSKFGITSVCSSSAEEEALIYMYLEWS
jgi:hypothetical protein